MNNKTYPYCYVHYDNIGKPLIYSSISIFLMGISQLITIQQETQIYLYYCKNEIIVYPDHVNVDLDKYTLATPERIPIHYNYLQLENWIRKITKTLPIL